MCIYVHVCDCIRFSLESPTRNLNLDAGQDIEIISAAGDIHFSSLLDINLNSKRVS